jgi:hypothetical protein
MWSAGSSRGTALEHREWQADAADNVHLYNEDALDVACGNGAIANLPGR